MDTVVELAFEGLRVLIRLIVAALELLLEGLRHIAKPLLQLLMEIAVEVIAQPSGRGWLRLHRWVGRVTGLPRLSIPITILLIMAVLVGAFVAIVKIGQAIWS